MSDLLGVSFCEIKWPVAEIVKYWAVAKLPAPIAIAPADMPGWTMYFTDDPKLFDKSDFNGKKMGDGSLVVWRGNKLIRDIRG